MPGCMMKGYRTTTFSPGPMIVELTIGLSGQQPSRVLMVGLPTKRTGRVPVLASS